MFLILIKGSIQYYIAVCSALKFQWIRMNIPGQTVEPSHAMSCCWLWQMNRKNFRNKNVLEDNEHAFLT